MPPNRTVRPIDRQLAGARRGRGSGLVRLAGCGLGHPAEIAVTHLLVLGELGGAALERHPADLEHDRAIRDRERHRRVLLDEHDGDALAVDLADHLAELLDDARRQAQRGLVEQQHARAGHQRAADREHLLLAAGEQAGGLAGALGENREQLVDPAAGALARRLVACRQASGAEVLRDRQAGEDPPALGHLHQPAAGDVGRVAADQAPARKRHRAAGDRAALPAQGP